MEQETILTPAQAAQYSPLALAFLGDSVYELLVRQALTGRGNNKAQTLHQEKVRLVCAAFQAQAAEMLLSSMTEAEQAVYRRGRNADSSPPKHANAADYRRATGLEAVFGYLQLTGDTARIHALFDSIWSMRDALAQSRHQGNKE